MITTGSGWEADGGAVELFDIVECWSSNKYEYAHTLAISSPGCSRAYLCAMGLRALVGEKYG